MRTLILVLLAVCIMAVPAFAADSTKGANYFESWVNDVEILNHDHRPVDVDKFQQGVGLDLTTYENETIALNTEARYNLDTKVTTIFNVVEVKKSLWSLFFNK